MTDTLKQYETAPGLKLGLTNLTAPVRVQAGPAGTAEVRVTGDDDYLKSVTVHYDQATNRLTVSEPEGSVGGSIIVSGGDVVIGRGATQINRFGSRGGASVISTGGGSVVIGSASGRVVVNGVDVTAAVSGGQAKPVVPSSIVVHVPTGTDTGVDDCGDVTTTGTAGRLRAHMRGTGSLKASGITGAKVRASGQSDVRLSDSTGPVDLTVSGQSGVFLHGRYDDVGLSVSGQSTVTGSGSYGHVSGEVSGQSSVSLGRAASQSVRSSGMSSVRIDAPTPQRRPSTGGWDF